MRWGAKSDFFRAPEKMSGIRISTDEHWSILSKGALKIKFLWNSGDLVCSASSWIFSAFRRGANTGWRISGLQSFGTFVGLFLCKEKWKNQGEVELKHVFATLKRDTTYICCGVFLVFSRYMQLCGNFMFRMLDSACTVHVRMRFYVSLKNSSTMNAYTIFASACLCVCVNAQCFGNGVKCDTFSQCCSAACEEGACSCSIFLGDDCEFAPDEV